MATDLLSYDEVLDRTNDNKRFLLLGNGLVCHIIMNVILQNSEGRKE